MNNTNLPITTDDFELLKNSVDLLESPSLVIQMTNAISEFGEKYIPSVGDGVKDKIIGIAESALHKVFDAAQFTMEDKTQDSSPWLHKIAAAAAGGAGGLFGMAAILVELPVSTTIMMRSILDIARAEGFSISDPRTKQECIKVFGLEGNKSNSDDNAESGYYTSRLALDEIIQWAAKAANKAAIKAAEQAGAKAINNAAAKAAVNGADKAVGNSIIKLIQVVASRFGVTLSEQAAAKSIPIFGAVAGSVLNTMFIDYYQDMAKGHFTIIKLEEKYSKEIIQEEYNKIYQEIVNKKRIK